MVMCKCLSVAYNIAKHAKNIPSFTMLLKTETAQLLHRARLLYKVYNLPSVYFKNKVATCMTCSLTLLISTHITHI